MRRGDGAGITQGLRGYPILAIGTVEIAAHHAEAVGESSGMGVEEGLLFHGIALGSGGVSPGNVEFAAAVEADFADSGLAFGDGTTMPAGEAAQAMVFKVLDQAWVGLADLLV